MNSNRSASSLAISCAMVPALIDSLGNHVLAGQQYRQVFVHARREDRDGWGCPATALRRACGRHAHLPPKPRASRKRKARNSRVATPGDADPSPHSSDGTSSTPQSKETSGEGAPRAKRTTRARHIVATRCARRGISRFRSVPPPTQRSFPPSSRRHRAPRPSATLCQHPHPDSEWMNELNSPPCERSAHESQRWGATEGGHDRVIKRRKLSKLELHAACSGRPTTNQLNYVLGRKRPFLGVDRADSLGDVPFGILSKLRGRSQQPRPLGVEGKECTEDCVVTKEPTARRVGVLKSGGDQTDVSESDVSKRLGEDVLVGGVGKDKQDGAWDSLHAAEVFKVNTEGMRRCPDGYRNEQGRMPCFSLLGDVVDGAFGVQSNLGYVPWPKVPIVRLPTHDADQIHFYAPPAHKAPKLNSQVGGHHHTKPEASSFGHTFTRGRVVVQPSKMNTSNKSTRVLQGLSGHVQLHDQAEDSQPQMLPCRSSSKQFHSFVQLPLEMQMRHKPSEIHAYHSPTGFSSDRRVRGMYSQTSRVHKVDSGGIKLLVQGDPSHSANQKSWTNTNKMPLQHLPGDFVDMLRRHGLTFPTGNSNSAVFGRRAHPALQVNRIVHPQDITEHRRLNGNLVVCNKDTIHMQHPLPVHHMGQPMGRPTKATLPEKNFRLNQQPVLMKVSSRWNTGAQFDVEEEPFMLPVMMLQNDKSGQD